MRVSRLLVAVAVLVALGGCAPAGGGKADSATMAADMAAIGKMRDAYAAAFKAGDASAIAALYTSDGMSQGNNAPTANGMEAIVAANKPLFDQYTITDMSLTPVKTDVSGTLGYDIGTYSFVGVPKAKGDTLKATGRYIVLARKQTDGSWKAIADMDNTTAPPPMPASMSKGKKGK